MTIQPIVMQSNSQPASEGKCKISLNVSCLLQILKLKEEQNMQFLTSYFSTSWDDFQVSEKHDELPTGQPGTGILVMVWL